MAAIDKIYLKYNDAKEFLCWIDEHDAEFVKEFKESKCPSLRCFLYFNEKHIDEIYENENDEHPICNMPRLVEYWLVKQNIPDAVRKELYFNYGLDDATQEEIDEFVNQPIEKQDPRPMGNHFKIVSRTGCLTGRNKGNLVVDNRTYWYYKVSSYKNFFGKNINVEELINDIYWHCEETGDIENIFYDKKKNIFTCKTSILLKAKSVKAIIRKLRKFKFPIGTVLSIEHWRYVGHIILVVTR